MVPTRIPTAVRDVVWFVLCVTSQSFPSGGTELVISNASVDSHCLVGPVSGMMKL